MKIYQYDFKNYKESTIEDLLYMKVDELIAYRDELFCSDAIDNVNINFTNLDRLIFTNLDQLSKSSKTSLTL